MKIAIACLVAAACAAEEPPPALATLPHAVELAEDVTGATLFQGQPAWVERARLAPSSVLHIGDAVVDMIGGDAEGGPYLVDGEDAMVWGNGGGFSCISVRVVPADGGAPFYVANSQCMGVIDELDGGLTYVLPVDSYHTELYRYDLASQTLARTEVLAEYRARAAARIGDRLMFWLDTGTDTAQFVVAVPRADPTHADVLFGGAAHWPLVGAGNDIYWLEGDDVYTMSLAPGADPPRRVAAAARPTSAWAATPTTLWLGASGSLQRIDVATGDSELFAVPYTVDAIVPHGDELLITTRTDARSIPVLVRQPLAPDP